MCVTMSSNERKSEKKYDVFLSFNGADTRYDFTANLYNALRRKRINTFFKDDDNDVDHHHFSLSSPVIEAIQDSRISIVVLSVNYASSSRCLDELITILHCKNKINDNQLVWPIFYGVKKWHVAYRIDSFGKSMAKLEQRLFRGNTNNNDRVLQWRAALYQVAILNGYMYHGDGYEYEVIEKIVDEAVASLPRYDIFLSFTGEDTRYSFTGHLYHALRQEGFKAFMDDDGLVGGNEISLALIEAIKKSRLSIVVFSENYAYSPWCLDELVEILDCMKANNQLVWPIFYKVDQFDVSNQTKSYGDAMIAHEKWFGKNSEKVKTWKSALSEVGNVNGEHIKENEYEYEFIKRIVEKAIDVENH